MADLGEKPIEYFTGKVEFNGLVLNVNPDVLIPRIETERLAQLAVEEVQKLGKDHLVIADVGTGSGAVAIYLAHTLAKQQHTYLASDISAPAVEVAQKNAKELVPNANISFFVSDILEQYPPTKLDIIIANLPYIPSGRIPVLDASVVDYEPHLALDGGEDGLQLIGQLLDTASKHLKPGGTILLEVDYTHTQDAFDQFTDRYNIEVFLDEFSRNRFVRCVLRNL